LKKCSETSRWKFVELTTSKVDRNERSWIEEGFIGPEDDKRNESGLEVFLPGLHVPRVSNVLKSQ
jgi:hypothetical protein